MPTVNPISITHLQARADADSALLAGLNALLQATVADGASVGFLSPLSTATATAYWQQVLAALSAQPQMWLAYNGTELVGTVQLQRCGKDNGHHRGEIQKLMVSLDYRGQGVATRLMAAAQAGAQAAGLSLLVLDTTAGSAAETLYRRLGWHEGGRIPAYAALPDGRLQATVYFYQLLG